jgi:hypothetical protein
MNRLIPLSGLEEVIKQVDWFGSLTQRATSMANAVVARAIDNPEQQIKCSSNFLEERIIISYSSGHSWTNVVFCRAGLSQVVSSNGVYYVYNPLTAHFSLGFGESSDYKRQDGWERVCVMREKGFLFATKSVPGKDHLIYVTAEYRLSDGPDNPVFKLDQTNIPVPDYTPEFIPDIFPLDSLIAKAVDPSGAGLGPEQAGPLATL